MSLNMVPIDDIIITGQMANLVGTGEPAVSNWKQRYTDFPQPFWMCGKIKLYRKSEFLMWYAQHFPDRVAAMRDLVNIIDHN